MNPRREASERVSGAYQVRVLEPSPPPVTDGPWFADDPAARGEAATGTPIVSPVTTGDVTWNELCHDDPELSSWCADRWLGAWRPLPPLPARDAFALTRTAWHTLAEHVLQPAVRPAAGIAPGAPDATLGAGSELSLKDAKDKWMQVLEASYLRDLLTRHDGNVSAAAKAAGIDRKTFHRLINKYRLK